MPISALDANTVKLITTTQVISSIYSVVKELVENALDANADNIEINLVDNGASLIEVKDNGCGISKEDVPYMALSSYTSKISDFEDLNTLQTFGFRGKALSALCAVAEVTVITKTHENTVGTLYSMNHNGQIMKHESCHRSIGTTIQARNLFKQIPVRRQIITNSKRANQAVKLLETLAQSFGICKPRVRINLRVNNNLIFTKPSLNDIKTATSHIFGRKITSNMTWIEPKDIEFTLQLMLPSKKIHDMSEITHAGLQYIFVNCRPIKHKDLEKIVNSAILEYLQQDSYRKKAIFLVYIVLKPTDIDVNLEPNKDIILFKDQNKVLDTIDKCIRTFYGLKSVEVVAQNTSDDTSVCYEDYAPNLNDDITDLPVCKKRKVQVQEKITQEGSMLSHSNDVTTNKHIDTCRNIQESDNKVYDKHYEDTLAFTNSLQPPNLSDSDSNDAFSIVTKPPNNDMMEKQETLSQLPVVDLGEDFEFTENGGWDTSKNNNSEDNLNKNQDNNKVSLETWSKGHVPGLMGGTNLKADTAIEADSNNSLKNKIDPVLESDEAHVDCKAFKFLKHVRSEVIKENRALTAVQNAKKITEFWKQLSSEERGYYRDIVQEEEKERQVARKTEERNEASKTEKNKNRLLQLFEKMKVTKNEKEEKKSNIRTIIPWIVDRNKIITRSGFENGHIIGPLTSNLWIATICEQIWIVDITSLIKGLHVTDIDIEKIDAQKIELLLKQWLLEQDNMSIMHSIYDLRKKV